MAGLPDDRGPEARRPDRRPPMAVAMEWVSKITTVSVMMVLPAGAGYWADRTFGTEPWLLILGTAAGMAVAMTQLLKMVGPARARRTERPEREQGGKRRNE